MAFDPTLPVTNSEIRSAELRNQFNGLKTLIDAVPAPGAETDPVFAASEAAKLVTGAKGKLDSALQDPTVFATAAQGAKAETALQPVNTAAGTYPVANDQVTSDQLAGITITNGLITAVTVVP